MKKGIKIIRSFIALLLAAAVVNVYVTEYFCIFDKNVTGHDEELALAEPAATPHSYEAEALEQHQNKNADDDNCCNDKTASFYSSLANPAPVVITFKCFASVFSVINSALELKISNTFLVQKIFSDKSPTPRIPDIRVSIQSFQI